MAASKQKVPWQHTVDSKRLKFVKTGPIPRLTEREKDFVRPPVIPPDLLNAPRCPICEKPVKHVSAHIQRIHSNKRHQCPFCSVSTTRRDHLKRHMQTLHPGLFAEMQREQDTEKDAKPRQKCEICFKDVVDLKGHHRKMHGTNDQGFIFECSHCPAKYRMQKTLANHTRRAHSHKSSCHSLEATARNAAENQEKEKCALCGLMIFKSDIRQHKDRHGRNATVPGVLRKYPCDVCGFRFKTKQHLKRHGIVHLNNGNMIEVDRLPSDQQRSRNWMCAVCAIRFRRKQHLQDHLKTHAKDPQTGLGQTSKGKRQCHICQSWHHPKKISRHIRTHSNTRLFVCGLDFCNKRFSRKADLDNHRLICKEMRAKQRENLIRDRVGEKVQCLRCRKLIRSKDFSRHRRWHFAEKLYHCTECRKNFTRKDHLKKHQLTHEKNRNLIPCPLYSCKFECKTKEGLARHLLLNPDCRKGYLGENAKLLKWKSQARGYPEKVVLVDYPVSDDDNEGPGTSFPSIDTLG